MNRVQQRISKMIWGLEHLFYEKKVQEPVWRRLRGESQQYTQISQKWVPRGCARLSSGAQTQEEDQWP